MNRASRIIRSLKIFPRRRFNIFSGSNTASEFWTAIKDYLNSDHESDAVIRAYEKAFADFTGSRFAFSFGAGRMALYAILESLDLQAGDEVILPAFTCVVVPNALIYRGVKPVYVDIEPRTFNIDPSEIEGAITPRTKAILAQNTFGVVCGIDEIKKIASAHGLVVIEDGAHSLGASYKGKRSGNLTDVAFFSSDHSKVINTLLGGMVTTSDPKIAARIESVQKSSAFLSLKLERKIIQTFLIECVCMHPWFYWLGRTMLSVFNRLGLLFYFHDELRTEKPTAYPYPCRLSSAQARIGISQLKNIDRNLSHRRQIAGWLESRLNWYQEGEEKRVEEQAWLRYSFRVKDREEFLRRFGRSFDLGVWFTGVVYGRDVDLEAVGYLPGSCPVAESAARQVVNLPTHLRIPLRVIQDHWARNEAWIRTSLATE